jgi:hypothetical protein
MIYIIIGIELIILIFSIIVSFDSNNNWKDFFRSLIILFLILNILLFFVVIIGLYIFHGASKLK